MEKLVNVELLYLFSLVLFVFAGFPIILDILMAYSSQNRIRALLIEKAASNGLSIKELKRLLEESRIPPPGIPGLARATIALTVIIILGIAVFYILLDPTKDSNVVNNLLSLLAGLLAAITGFYFGGKTVEKKVGGPNSAG